MTWKFPVAWSYCFRKGLIFADVIPMSNGIRHQTDASNYRHIPSRVYVKDW